MQEKVSTLKPPTSPFENLKKTLWCSKKLRSMMMRFIFHRAENIVGKEKNDRYKLSFHRMFLIIITTE